jgi:hypothetical protein
LHSGCDVYQFGGRAERTPRETETAEASVDLVMFWSYAPLAPEQAFRSHPLSRVLYGTPQQRVICNEMGVAKTLQTQHQVGGMKLDDDWASSIGSRSFTDHDVAGIELCHKQQSYEMGRRLTPPLLSPSLFSRLSSSPSPLFLVLQTPADASFSTHTSKLATSGSLQSTKLLNAEPRWLTDRSVPVAHLSTQRAVAPVP